MDIKVIRPDGSVSWLGADRSVGGLVGKKVEVIKEMYNTASGEKDDPLKYNDGELLASPGDMGEIFEDWGGSEVSVRFPDGRSIGMHSPFYQVKE